MTQQKTNPTKAFVVDNVRKTGPANPSETTLFDVYKSIKSGTISYNGTQKALTGEKINLPILIPASLKKPDSKRVKSEVKDYYYMSIDIDDLLEKDIHDKDKLFSVLEENGLDVFADDSDAKKVATGVLSYIKANLATTFKNIELAFVSPSGAGIKLIAPFAKPLKGTDSTALYIKEVLAEKHFKNIFANIGLTIDKNATESFKAVFLPKTSSAVYNTNVEKIVIDETEALNYTSANSRFSASSKSKSSSTKSVRTKIVPFKMPETWRIVDSLNYLGTSALKIIKLKAIDMMLYNFGDTDYGIISLIVAGLDRVFRYDFHITDKEQRIELIVDTLAIFRDYCKERNFRFSPTYDEDIYKKVNENIVNPEKKGLPFDMARILNISAINVAAYVDSLKEITDELELKKKEKIKPLFSLVPDLDRLLLESHRVVRKTASGKYLVLPLIEYTLRERLKVPSEKKIKTDASEVKDTPFTFSVEWFETTKKGFQGALAYLKMAIENEWTDAEIKSKNFSPHTKLFLLSAPKSLKELATFKYLSIGAGLLPLDLESFMTDPRFENTTPLKSEISSITLKDIESGNAVPIFIDEDKKPVDCANAVSVIFQNSLAIDIKKYLTAYNLFKENKVPKKIMKQLGLVNAQMYTMLNGSTRNFLALYAHANALLGGEKVNVAPVIYGEMQGIGKNFWVKILEDALPRFGVSYLPGAESLLSRFNQFLLSPLVCISEFAVPRKDADKVMSTLKNYITAETIDYEAKGRDAEIKTAKGNFIMLSNEALPFNNMPYSESPSNRRFFPMPTYNHGDYNRSNVEKVIDTIAKLFNDGLYEYFIAMIRTQKYSKSILKVSKEANRQFKKNAFRDDSTSTLLEDFRLGLPLPGSDMSSKRAETYDFCLYDDAIKDSDRCIVIPVSYLEPMIKGYWADSGVKKKGLTTVIERIIKEGINNYKGLDYGLDGHGRPFNTAKGGKKRVKTTVINSNMTVRFAMSGALKMSYILPKYSTLIKIIDDILSDSEPSEDLLSEYTEKDIALNNFLKETILMAQEDFETLSEIKIPFDFTFIRNGEPTPPDGNDSTPTDDFSEESDFDGNENEIPGKEFVEIKEKNPNDIGGVDIYNDSSPSNYGYPEKPSEADEDLEELFDLFTARSSSNDSR